MSTKKVLSWDVGIKNLAYCLLEIAYDTTTFNILQWDIINLASNRPTCCFVKKGETSCDKIATTCAEINGETKYYCTSHVTKIDIAVHAVNVTSALNDNNEICGKCSKLALYKTNVLTGYYCQRHLQTELNKSGHICCHTKCSNFVCYTPTKKDNETDIIKHGWCKDHFDEDFKTYVTKKIKKIPHNCNRISLDVLSCSMYQQLDNNPAFLMVDEVLIENQPSFINPTMKTVSALLYSYFMMRGIYEKTKTKSTIKTVSFCSPTNKLKVDEQTTKAAINKTPDETINSSNLKSEPVPDTKKQNIYKITKNLGILYCTALISDNKTLVEQLKSHKKKDDLCDAFLQGFVMSFKTVPPKYYTKLKQVIKSDTVSLPRQKPIRSTKKSRRPAVTKQHLQLNEQEE